MSDAIKIIECPRDAWQGLGSYIPAAEKACYLQMLIAAGFTHLDAVSFVSPAAVPQMADSEEVLALLDTTKQTEIIAIVVNQRGAGRATTTGKVSTLGFPFSISAEFLRRNQNQTPEQALTAFDAIRETARAAGMGTIAYISMSFGNPYGEAWSVDVVRSACERLRDHGAQQISLADTVGLATPARIAETVESAFDACPDVEIGVHLHARRQDAPNRIRAAYDAGCRRFDSAIAGLGGCPFAQDDLVGNIPTEVLVQTLSDPGAAGPRFTGLDELVRVSTDFVRRYGGQEKAPSGGVS